LPRSILQTFDHRVAARWATTTALSVEYMPETDGTTVPVGINPIVTLENSY
jgi:hypothetical protein